MKGARPNVRLYDGSRTVLPKAHVEPAAPERTGSVYRVSLARGMDHIFHITVFAASEEVAKDAALRVARRRGFLRHTATSAVVVMPNVIIA